MPKIAQGKDFLGATIKVVFDRPLGSVHPKYPEMIYPVNYGYVPDTRAGDGDEIDVYYLSADRPLKTVAARCIGYVHRDDDNEDKLIASDGTRFSEAEIESKLEFQEKWFKHQIVLEDEAS